MHPLMNHFHADEQRRLMELLGVKETIAPLVSRRVFLQSAGATGLAIGFGWLAPMDGVALGRQHAYRLCDGNDDR